MELELQGADRAYQLRSIEMPDSVDVPRPATGALFASGLRYSLDDSRGLVAGGALEHSLKRALDVVLAALALIALSPLLLLVALAIKLTSRGPVLFIQQRPGLNGKLFPMLKFRTMFTHLGDKVGKQQTVRNDTRVTPIGRFLRKTSIDELPQLINVLIGHMSIIGPRPHPVVMFAAGRPYEELVPYYDMRLAMRPGLSGWAQVNGFRGPTDQPELAFGRINHDVAYIQNFSIALDVKIIVATIRHEFLAGSGF